MEHASGHELSRQAVEAQVLLGGQLLVEVPLKDESDVMADGLDPGARVEAHHSVAAPGWPGEGDIVLMVVDLPTPFDPRNAKTPSGHQERDVGYDVQTAKPLDQVPNRRMLIGLRWTSTRPRARGHVSKRRQGGADQRRASRPRPGKAQCRRRDMSLQVTDDASAFGATRSSPREGWRRLTTEPPHD